MLHDASQKGWWTFKIKVKLICLIYYMETFTNESYLYFVSPPTSTTHPEKHHATYKVLEINFWLVIE